jgi:mycothiol synthase
MPPGCRRYNVAIVTTVTAAESDADLDQWRQVRIAVVPGERAPTVAELRAEAAPGRLLVLAKDGGQLVGSGIADNSGLKGGFVCPRVLPGARRRGVGTAILLALAEHCVSLGHDVAGSRVEDEGSAAFARRFGFAETDREVEQVYAVGAEPEPLIPPGISIARLADRPELAELAYHRLNETFADLALTSVLQVSLQEWQRDWTGLPEASFVALDCDGEVVGTASLRPDPDKPGRAENGYTAVRREWRGRGVAAALKRTGLAWAGRNGIAEIYTWTQQGNHDMRAVNERLGYTYAAVSIRVEAALPLSPLPLSAAPRAGPGAAG